MGGKGRISDEISYHTTAALSNQPSPAGERKNISAVLALYLVCDAY